MSSIEKYSDRIANYVYNDMSLLERKQFEEDLIRDNELAEEYKRQVHMVDYLKSRSALEEMTSATDLDEARRVVDDFYNSSGELSQESRPQPLKSKKVRRMLYPIIGVAAIFIGLLIYKISFLDPLNERLYNRNYKPLEASSFVYRGDQDQFDLMLKEGVSFYLQGSNRESNVLFKELFQGYPDNPEVSLYYGLSSLALEEYEEAIKLFELHIENNAKYTTEAKWYIGLCHVKLDNIAEARFYFEDLSQIGGYYGKKSLEILKKLDR